MRVQQLKLTEHQDRMTGAGVTTFPELAFFSGLLPGGTEEVFNNSLALLLGAIDHIHPPALTRLFIEAYTLASADLQRRVEPRNELATALMPSAEREARLKALLAAEDHRPDGSKAERCVGEWPPCYMRFIRMFFQDGLTGSAWGD